MKIWFDATLYSSAEGSLSDQSDQIYRNDWDDDYWSDWDKDRTMSYPTTTLTALPSQQGCSFALSSLLHIQACDDEHWLVCRPQEQQRIAVLDAPALALLERFRVPLTMIEAFQHGTKGEALHTLRAVNYFMLLQLLRRLDQAPAVVPGEAPEQSLSADSLRREALRLLRCQQPVVL